MSNARMSSEEILEVRARHLARRASTSTAASDVEVLGFTLGRERYGVESRFVFAVVQLADLVPLPSARAPVVGVTRWRGDVLTVLDLRRVVGGVAHALDDLGRVVVIGSVRPEFGILGDTIDGMFSIDPTRLHPVPAGRQLEIPGLIQGVTPDAVHVLDAAVLIAHQTGSTESTTHIASPSPLPQ
jgi:chemotaxis signal transduction protein